MKRRAGAVGLALLLAFTARAAIFGDGRSETAAPRHPLASLVACVLPASDVEASAVAPVRAAPVRDCAAAFDAEATGHGEAWMTPC